MTSNQTSPVNISAVPWRMAALGWISNISPWWCLRIRCGCCRSGGSVSRDAGPFLVGGRGPAGQQVQRVAGGGARFGGVDEQDLAGIGGHLQGLKGQSEVTDEGMVDLLDPPCGGTSRRARPSGP